MPIQYPPGGLQQPRQLGPQTIPQLIEMLRQQKMQKQEMGLKERGMTLEEEIGQARIGAYQKQEMPEPELEQLQGELQYWQGVYGRTYEKGMLGGWGEIADPQTKKMAETRISQIGKRIVEILSKQPTPRKRVESREVIPAKPTLSLSVTPKTPRPRTVSVTPTKEPEKYVKPKEKAARSARIRMWVVPFNLKHKARLDPKILDAMNDETIDKLSKLKPDRLEKALQAIFNGASEQELLTALGLEGE